MPGIEDHGTTEPTVSTDESAGFAWEQELDATDEETTSIPEELMAEVSEKLGLIETEADTIGEERLRMLLKKVEPAEEPQTAPKPKAKPRSKIKEPMMDEDFDPRIVKIFKDNHSQMQALEAQVDAMTEARQTDAVADLRSSLKDAGKKAGVSSSDMKRADEALVALKSGYGDNMPGNDELVEMALRSITGMSTDSDRSDQFVHRPTHRNTKGGSSKETNRDKAIRNVKAWMDENVE